MIMPARVSSRPEKLEGASSSDRQQRQTQFGNGAFTSGEDPAMLWRQCGLLSLQSPGKRASLHGMENGSGCSLVVRHLETVHSRIHRVRCGWLLWRSFMLAVVVAVETLLGPPAKLLCGPQPPIHTSTLYFASVSTLSSRSPGLPPFFSIQPPPSRGGCSALRLPHPIAFFSHTSPSAVRTDSPLSLTGRGCSEPQTPSSCRCKSHDSLKPNCTTPIIPILPSRTRIPAPATRCTGTRRRLPETTLPVPVLYLSVKYTSNGGDDRPPKG